MVYMVIVKEKGLCLCYLLFNCFEDEGKNLVKAKWFHDIKVYFK